MTVSNNPTSSTLKINPEQLSWTCDLQLVRSLAGEDGNNNEHPVPSTSNSMLQQQAGASEVLCSTTTHGELSLSPNSHIIGQDRAVKALIMGCEVQGPGYNVFVCGPAGTGKASTVNKVLVDLQKKHRFNPRDRVYVNNFIEREKPRLLTLPPGVGSKLRRGMDDLIKYLCREIPRAFEGESFQKSKDKAINRFEKDERKILRRFEDKARKHNFVLSQVQSATFTRPDLLVVVGKHQYEMDDLASAITAGEVKNVNLEEIERRYLGLRNELDALLRSIRRKGRDLMDEIATLERQAGKIVVGGFLDDLKETFNQPELQAYFSEVESNILDNLHIFVEQDDEPEGGQPAARHGQGQGQGQGQTKHGSDSDPYRDFRVNVILDNCNRTHSPLVVETTPTYANLFGTIERDGEDGPGLPHFLRLKAGSILEADQGFLVFHAPDAFSEPGVWKALKRTLKHGKLEFQAAEGQGALSLKPDPIDVDVKVIVTGDAELYYELFVNDEEFPRIFKIKADFEELLTRNTENIRKYAQFIRRFCQEENLRNISDEAVARLIEFSAREADHSSKLSARFSLLADLLREADYYAQKCGQDTLNVIHIEQAKQARIARHDLLERRYREEIDEGTILINTSSSEIGQINGLTVIDHGDHRFGRPCLITAAVGAGMEGLISLEREANMSGPIHSKGVMTIAGFLRSRFGMKEPLALSASLSFEQSYDEVDGDSASCGELCAIMSALSGVPAKQGIAITGSMNQTGVVQAIGGVNEKIEGFFSLCERRGLTGQEGVIIPATNVSGLMLDERVTQAVQNGKFNAWQVNTIEECIELLTGVEAGILNPEDNQYPAGTVFRMVQDRLDAFSRTAKEKPFLYEQTVRSQRRQAAAPKS